MTGSRPRRILAVLLVFLLSGLALVLAVRQWAALTPEQLDRTAAHVMQWREVLDRHGLWLHLGLHGATYLYLVLCWPRLVAWLNRKRAERGHVPLSPPEQRRLVVAVVAVCVAYEGLLLLRHLG